MIEHRGDYSPDERDFWQRERYGKELILMMNNLSDSRHWSENVCWLYDADFEFLNRENIKNIVVTGPRAKDYYLRLKMAGIDDSRISFAEHELDAPCLLYTSRCV